MTAPFNICTEAEAPFSAADSIAYASIPPSWTTGMAGTPRPVSPATDSGIPSMLLAMLVLIGLNIKPLRRVLAALPAELLYVRRRDNAFDEHTANEARAQALLIATTCIMEGLLLFMWTGNIHSATSAQWVLNAAGCLIGLAAAYYVFQLAACATLGYVFTDPLSANLWRRGLNASTTALGISLTVPTLVALFYPALTSKMLVIAAALYILSRICYISKGFRIFYYNFGSLLYFILYLCTLEIVPVAATCFLASEICEKVQ